MKEKTQTEDVAFIRLREHFRRIEVDLFRKFGKGEFPKRLLPPKPKKALNKPADEVSGSGYVERVILDQLEYYGLQRVGYSAEAPAAHHIRWMREEIARLEGVRRAAGPDLIEAAKRALAEKWCTPKTCGRDGVCICNALADAVAKAEGT